MVRGLEFLRRSGRSDGSWAIDSNLATWVTTLSVNALAAGNWHGVLSERERLGALKWLLAQQGRRVHPYTGAAPGGWAWTDLPGGVPDADDTAGALIALAHLGRERHDLAFCMQKFRLIVCIVFTRLRCKLQIVSHRRRERSGFSKHRPARTSRPGGNFRGCRIRSLLVRHSGSGDTPNVRIVDPSARCRPLHALGSLVAGMN